MCRCELSRQLVLQVAKRLLALGTNDNRYRAPRAALDLSVEVHEPEIQSPSQERADGAFPGSRKPDENEVTVHLRRWAM
jgi:hypothetical protein